MNVAVVQPDDPALGSASAGLRCGEMTRELPEPVREPMAPDAVLRRLGPPRRRAVQSLLDRGVRVYTRHRTRTWIDIGGWLGPRPVDLFTLDTGLFLLATGYPWEGDRPLISQAPATDLAGSIYNHVTGRLLLAPAPKLRAGALKLHPLHAYQVLAQLHHQLTHPTTCP